MQVIRIAEYKGPHYADGWIRVGRTANGREASVPLVQGECLWGGVAVGNEGSGTTNFLELVALGARASGEMNVLIGDGSMKGDSSELLNAYSSGVAWGGAAIRAQAAALKIYLEERLAQRSAAGRAEFKPSSEQPGLLWILPEFSRVAAEDYELTEQVCELASDGAKLGLAVWVETCGLELSAFGCNSRLRELMLSQNVAAFRTDDPYAWSIPGGTLRARALPPRGAGYAQLAVPGAAIEQIRTEWTKDKGPWARETRSVPWDDGAARALRAVMPA